MTSDCIFKEMLSCFDFALLKQVLTMQPRLVLNLRSSSLGFPEYQNYGSVPQKDTGYFFFLKKERLGGDGTHLESQHWGGGAEMGGSL